MDKRSPVNSSSWKSIKPSTKQDDNLATDPEMCMFALTVSIVEPKNIKEVMANSVWIEAMQEELHQFERLQVWELVDKPFGKNEEGIDFKKSFALVAPEALRILTSDPPIPRGDKQTADVKEARLYCKCHPQRLEYWLYLQVKAHVENGIIELYFVKTEYQLADMFTKALPEERFQYLVRRIGMRCLTPAELEVLTNESA
ncbi:hypothetical protein Tco_1136047 [Tanacetum coccineum]